MKTVGREELVRRVKGYLAGLERKSVNVLVVEDSPTDAHLIIRALEKSRRHAFKVAHVQSLHEAEEYCYANQIDVIVQDLTLPDSRKKDTLVWMLKQEYPIVVITGDESDETVSEAFRHGRRLSCQRDFSEREAARCVMYAVERFYGQKRDLPVQEQS